MTTFVSLLFLSVVVGAAAHWGFRRPFFIPRVHFHRPRFHYLPRIRRIPIQHRPIIHQRHQSFHQHQHHHHAPKVVVRPYRDQVIAPPQGLGGSLMGLLPGNHFDSPLRSARMMGGAGSPISAMMPADPIGLSATSGALDLRGSMGRGNIGGSFLDIGGPSLSNEIIGTGGMLNSLGMPNPMANRVSLPTAGINDPLINSMRTTNDGSSGSFANNVAGDVSGMADQMFGNMGGGIGTLATDPFSGNAVGARPGPMIDNLGDVSGPMGNNQRGAVEPLFNNMGDQFAGNNIGGGMNPMSNTFGGGVDPMSNSMGSMDLFTNMMGNNNPGIGGGFAGGNQGLQDLLNSGAGGGIDFAGLGV